MKILDDKSIKSIPEQEEIVATVGTFDGVHRGHQLILQQLIDIATKLGYSSLLFTFLQHPRHVLYHENNEVGLLTTVEEKLYLLKTFNLHYVFFKNFTPEFAQYTPFEFIENYLYHKLHVRALVVGYDHSFGKNREGSIETLESIKKSLQLNISYVEPLEIDGLIVSSSTIRKLLMRGKISLANRLLGHPYLIMGTVTHGDHRGNELGFPTANILVLHPYKLLPKNGVYAATIEIKDHTYLGMVNIGTRPTFDGLNTRIEAHVFDFSEQIYGQQINLHLHERLRDEIKFSSTDELISQLKKDKAKSLAILANVRI